METALLQTAIFAAEKLLEAAPALFTQLSALFSKSDVTLADLQAARDALAAQHYKDAVPNTQIPPDEQT